MTVTTMAITVYCINKGTKAQYFGLKSVESGAVLHFAPNNWKTEAGARRWAEKHGFKVV